MSRSGFSALAAAMAFAGLPLLLLLGCAPEGAAAMTAAPVAAQGVSGTDPTTDAGAADPAAASAAALEAACAKAPGVSREAQVCHRWRCDGRAAASPASWTGNAATCSPGELDLDAGERALRMVNLHRYLADLPEVTAEPAWTGAAQQCALVAHANAKLSHTPPSSWACWSSLAALTSSISLIANRSAPISIHAYMEDPGNEATMVHRRWLLSETLGAVGLGSTDRYSCLVVDGQPIDALTGRTRPTAKLQDREPRGWSTWPPAGPVPYDVFTVERLDTVGWTVQSSDDALDRARVTVSVDGAPLPVTTTRLTPLMGSRAALRFVPKGWTTQTGRRYAVHVEATGMAPIDFVVEPTACL